MMVSPTFAHPLTRFLSMETTHGRHAVGPNLEFRQEICGVPNKPRHDLMLIRNLLVKIGFKDSLEGPELVFEGLNGPFGEAVGLGFSGMAVLWSRGVNRR